MRVCTGSTRAAKSGRVAVGGSGVLGLDGAFCLARKWRAEAPVDVLDREVLILEIKLFKVLKST